MTKVKEINLEYGSPTVDTAVRNMINQLTTCKGQGCKAAVLVHGLRFFGHRRRNQNRREKQAR